MSAEDLTGGAGRPGGPAGAPGQPTEEELAASIEKMWDGDGLISLVMIPNLLRDAATNARAAEYSGPVTISRAQPNASHIRAA